MIDFILVTLLFSFSLPISALLLTGPRAFYFAAPLTLCVAVIAGFGHVLFDIPIVIFWALLLLLPGIAVLALPTTRERIRATLNILRYPMADRINLGISYVAMFLVSVSVQPPLRWDARSIWFHHASWLDGPAKYFIEAQFLPAGSWPDYPFAGPALMALTWQTTFSGENLWLATRVIAIAVISTAAFVSQSIVEKYGISRHWLLKSSVFIALMSSSTLIADGYFNAGYQDTLLAVSTVALLFSILIDSRSKAESIGVPAILFLAASNIKQEGFWFALGTVLVTVFALLIQKRFAPLLLVPIALASRLVWSAFSTAVDMPDNSHTSLVLERVPELLDSGSVWSAKFAEVVGTWVIPKSVPYLLLAVLVSLAFLVSEMDKKQKIATALVTLAVPIGLLFTSIVTYSLGETHDLQWWLGTSYTRVTSTFEFVVLSLGCAAAVALIPFDQRLRSNSIHKAKRR